MKKIITLLALLAITVGVEAQTSIGWSTFSTGGTKLNGTNYAVIP